jgi:TolB-like protein
MKKTLFLFIGSLFFCAVPALGDEYDQLAKELCQVNISTGQGKIAILPFSYLDKRKSDGGMIVSERLTTRVVKLKKFQVIERQLLENVMQEQHLEKSGIVDNETAKQIGKILGVDAVINGTLLDVENGMAEVNARLIKTETAEVVATGSAQVKKIWSDVAINQPSQPAAQVQQAQPEYQQPEQPAYKQSAPARSGYFSKMQGFIDIFTGSGSGQMKVIFNNTSRTIKETELSLDLNGNGKLDPAFGYNKLTFDKLDSEGSAPIGLRMVGFGKNFGFGFEISSFDQAIKKQSTTVSYNDSSPTGFAFYGNDYLKMSVFTILSGDILFRFFDKAFQPYIGMGIGMSLNTISSPYITQSTGKLDEMAVGFLVRLPVLGIRILVGNSASVFLEQRTIIDTASFSRNLAAESNSVTITATQTLMGVGFKFQ